MQNSQERLESYKNGGKHSEWKDKYRQKCLERLKNGRKKVQEQFRSLSMADTGVANELAKEISTNLVEDVLADTSILATERVELFEELSEELQGIVMEMVLSQEIWETGMQQLENKNPICPICRQDYLCEGETMITCSCGLYLENDILNLKQLEEKLHEATSKHSLTYCEGKVQFNVVEIEDLSLLVLNMQCISCGISELIL